MIKKKNTAKFRDIRFFEYCILLFFFLSFRSSYL